MQCKSFSVGRLSPCTLDQFLFPRDVYFVAFIHSRTHPVLHIIMSCVAHLQQRGVPLWMALFDILEKLLAVNCLEMGPGGMENITSYQQRDRKAIF